MPRPSARTTATVKRRSFASRRAAKRSVVPDVKATSSPRHLSHRRGRASYCQGSVEPRRWPRRASAPAVRDPLRELAVELDLLGQRGVGASLPHQVPQTSKESASWPRVPVEPRRSAFPSFVDGSIDPFGREIKPAPRPDSPCRVCKTQTIIVRILQEKGHGPSSLPCQVNTVAEACARLGGRGMVDGRAPRRSHAGRYPGLTTRRVAEAFAIAIRAATFEAVTQRWRRPFHSRTGANRCIRNRDVEARTEDRARPATSSVAEESASSRRIERLPDRGAKPDRRSGWGRAGHSG